MSPINRTKETTSMKRLGKIGRRKFLKRSASAAIAAPLFFPRHVLGASGTPGANEDIVLGIVGMGVRGNDLAGNIPAGGRIAAICDVDSRKTDEASKKFQAKWKVYHDYRKMFEQEDLDAVIVCPCDHHHVHASILACQAGLDVYVEKPLSMCVAEGRALVHAARKCNRVVQTGTQQRTMEMDRFACELVRDGGIGEVRKVECVNYSGPIPYPKAGLPAEVIPSGFDWDLWQGPATVHPFNRLLASHHTIGLPRHWGSWWDYSIGDTGGLGSHAYDMVQFALGADETGPVEFWLVEPDRGPAARVDFRYANGVEVQLKFSSEPPYRGPQLGAVFVGDLCKIEINRNKFTTNPKDFVKNGPDPESAKIWDGDNNIARGHVQNWFDCIKSRRKPNADVEIGHRTATVLHLINIVREVGHVGETLKWDPAIERFSNSEQANKLLDRPRRKGWELPNA